VDTRNSIFRILHKTLAQSHKARSSAHPRLVRDSYGLRCCIDMHGRECSSATVETAIGARISPAMPPAWLCTHRRQTSTKGPTPYIHAALGDVAAHALAI
jgi:hypothetical protein